MIPYDKREGKIWYNNELVEWQDATLHVISHGLHYASLVFEGLRVYDGEIFKLCFVTLSFLNKLEIVMPSYNDIRCITLLWAVPKACLSKTFLASATVSLYPLNIFSIYSFN